MSLLLAAACLLPLAAGCRQWGYSTEKLHYDNVRTVFLEMFDNRTFRRGLEYDLSRALAVQIELHTPYKIITDRDRADTIVSGSIVGVSEGVLTQQRDLDRPLESQVVMLVEVTWKDLRSGELLLDHQPVRATGEYLALLAAGRDSAARQAAEEIAIRIVEAMERPW